MVIIVMLNVAYMYGLISVVIQLKAVLLAYYLL